MNIKTFARKYGSYGARLNEIAERYDRACNTKISNQAEFKLAKENMINATREFERLRDVLEQIPAPSGFSKEKEKMDKLFAEYVSHIVQKTERFSLEAIETGEIEGLTELEMDASRQYKEYLIDFTKKHVM